MSETEKNGIKIPGFEFTYPKTTTGALSIFFISATIVLSLFIIFVWAKNISDVAAAIHGIQANAYRSSSDGEIRKLSSRTQIQFMTPSSESYEFHKRKYNYSTSTKKDVEKFNEMFEWEKGVDSIRTKKFGDLLIRKGISSGYRFYNYRGEGSTQEDVGLWWVVTTNIDNPLSDFVTFYLEFWDPPNGIYIEEIRTGADIKSDE